MAAVPSHVTGLALAMSVTHALSRYAAMAPADRHRGILSNIHLGGAIPGSAVTH